MPSAIELLRQGRIEDLWQMCCGFVDLSMEQFMAIQRRLLLEQLELLNGCELGNEIMHGRKPASVDEFRNQAPLTTYSDYAPYLQKRREDVLPEKPILWMRCVGRSGEYKFKWVPVTERVYNEAGKLVFAAAVFASCNKRGDIAIKERDKFLHALAPPPYATGMMAHMVDDVFRFALVPSLDLAENMTFDEKIKYGFNQSLSDGLDLFGGLTSVLYKVGERFSQEINSNNNILSLISRPRAFHRLGKGWLKSKLARRPMMPKDVWAIKGLVGGGTDTSIYMERVKEMWGRYPLCIYGCTENIVTAMQTWDYQGMTFNPYLSFLEFIPEEEYHRWKQLPAYKPTTLLLDEVEPGQSYVIVITNFHGGPFARYIIGDMVKITSLRNEELDINIPQVMFDRRVDGLIDIAGFARLTERRIGQAIEEAGLVCQDWIARKEALKEEPVLHLYLERDKADNNGVDEEQLATAIHQQLRKLDNDYADLEFLLDLKPLKVTLLPNGAIKESLSNNGYSSSDLVHMNTSRINPPDDIMDILLASAQAKPVSSVSK